MTGGAGGGEPDGEPLDTAMSELAEVMPGAPRPPSDVIDAVYDLVAGDRGGSATRRELLRSMLATVWVLAEQETEIGDLKIADAALAEMAEAFRVFRPYRDIRKLTMFGRRMFTPNA